MCQKKFFVLAVVIPYKKVYRNVTSRGQVFVFLQIILVIMKIYCALKIEKIKNFKSLKFCHLYFVVTTFY